MEFLVKFLGNVADYIDHGGYYNRDTGNYLVNASSCNLDSRRQRRRRTRIDGFRIVLTIQVFQRSKLIE